MPATRAEKRAKKRAGVRPTIAAQPAGAVSTPSTKQSAPRPAWMAPTRTTGRGSGMIRDEDYRYIYGDLKRIGILAGTGFATLIILSFVLR